MLIHILRADGTQDDVDESALIKIQVLIDDAEATTMSVEYCLAGCDGPAHARRIADAAEHFCSRHVHRSVNMQLKKWPEGLSAVAAQL